MTVYFIQAGTDGPIKIGHSATDGARRLASLQTASPWDLFLLASLPGERHDERALHRRFAEHKLRGEWFRPHPDLLDFIANIDGFSFEKIDASPTEPETEALLRAIAMAGSQAELARKIGRSQQHFSLILSHRVKRISAEDAIKVDGALGGAVGKAELRPDLFGPASCVRRSAA